MVEHSLGKGEVESSILSHSTIFPFGSDGFAWALAQAYNLSPSKNSAALSSRICGNPSPGAKVMGKIAEVRGLKEGQDAISPARFPDWTEPAQIKEFADEVRSRTGGIPIGYKL